MPNWTRAEVVVPAGGAVGGLLSILMPKLGVSTTVFPSEWWTFLAGMVVGAVAAFVGVFLLFNTDRSDKPRLLSWAIMLGLLWQPVIAAGTLLVDNLTNQKKTEARTTETVAKISQIMNAPPTNQSAGELNDAGKQLVVLAQKAGDIRDDVARHAVGAQLAKAINDLDTLRKKDSRFTFIAADAIYRVNAVVDTEKLPNLKQTLIDKSEIMATVHDAPPRNDQMY